MLADVAGEAIDRLVRTEQDFPEPGVLFRDLTPVLADARALGLLARAARPGWNCIPMTALPGSP